MTFKAIYITYIYTFIFFIASPIVIYFFINDNFLYLLLAFLISVSTLMLFLGYKIPLNFPRINFTRLVINAYYFYIAVVFCFVLFVFYSFYSFGGIPLIQSFSLTEDPNLLRGELYKGRTGYETVLLYLSAIFTYTFVPLAVLVAFKSKFKSRFFFLFFSILFCIATLQKALLLNVLIPLVAYFLISGEWKLRTFFMFVLSLFFYFVVMIAFTGHGDGVSENYRIDFKVFFSSSFSPNGAIEYFIWRFFSVPIYTAIDTLHVYKNILLEVNTLGGTSSLISYLFGLEKVELEKIVFEYQFGHYNPLANANTNSSVVLYVDFWFYGLVFISFLLGMVFRILESSKDIVIVCIGYFFAYSLLNAPLFGTLFSSGFLYVIFHSIFLKFKY